VKTNKKLIQEVMKKKGLNMSTLAEKAGMSRQLFRYHWNSDEANLKFIEKIAHALYVNPKKLLV